MGGLHAHTLARLGIGHFRLADFDIFALANFNRQIGATVETVGKSKAEVTAAMGTIEGVLDVHDLHIWSLGSQTHALSCHVKIDDVPPSASDSILERRSLWAS